MAGKYETSTYKKLPLHFMGESDPLYSMLQWLTERMMEVESEMRVGASKGKHSSDRITYFSGTRVRRFDTRLGTLYLLVPMLRQGGYVPFFVTEKKRSSIDTDSAGGLHQRCLHTKDGTFGTITRY